jgi:N-acetylglucosamine-6-phosphate deacetylase
MPDREYAIDERTVRVKDGVVRLADGNLAGSTPTMDRSLRNLMDATRQQLEAIWQTSSLNAARSIHLADRKGSLEVGKDADLVLVDDQIKVHLTIAEGAIVYRKPGF